MLDRVAYATKLTLLICLIVSSFCATSRAGERYIEAPFSTLRFDGTPPQLPIEDMDWVTLVRLGFTKSMRTYAVLDVPGEIYLTADPDGRDTWSRAYSNTSTVLVRADDSAPIRGRLFVANGEKSLVEVFRFEVPLPASEGRARTAFMRAKAVHYDSLLTDRMPGAAWFRHQRDQARKELGTDGGDTDRFAGREPADVFDLFTGGRAIAENLDLDRSLRVAKAEDQTIDVNSIEGVTTRALDWKTLIKDMKPDLDPLARFVPADQHAVFFTSFEAMTRVVDDLDSTGTTLIEAFEARVEDQRTKERYQKQLCMPLSTLGRLLGPTVVESVAMTGADPFLPSGADVAILFDCKLPDVLEKFIGMRRAEAEKAGAERVSGRIGELVYEGAVSPDRAISCYTARVDSVVVVSNSLQTLVRVMQTARDSSGSLLGADEYVWFRDRYKRGADGESAFIVLTDATIRRWAGPRSRIGDARRLIAAAAMNEITARNADAIVAGTIAAGTKASAPDLAISEDFVWGDDGVRSLRFGTMRFLTPIVELGVDRVSEAERAAYSVYRNSFQQRWRNYFDPIAVRLSFDGVRMKADVTVMPLTIDTEYRELQRFTGGGALPQSAGDPHEGALFHFASALSKTSELGEMLSGVVGSNDNRFGVDPLGWLGASITVYGEKDPWWDEVIAAGGLFEGEDIDYYRMPLALQVDVKDPLKLAAFLTALRAFADESAPNLTKWETRTWHDVSYVAIAPTESLGLTEPGRDPHIYYAPLPDMLVLSLREDLIQKAIDRRQARKEGKSVEGSERAWLGKTAGLRIEGDALGSVLGVFESWSDRDTAAVWSTIPILNEWKLRYPSEDPVRVHERLFGVKLTTPTKQALTWNDEFQSMESPEFGRPGSPKPRDTNHGTFRDILRAEFGIEFENDGLRAVVEVTKRR